MPIVATIEVGRVTAVWGAANLQLPNGKTRPLKVGDMVQKGDVILTAQDSIVEIKNATGETYTTAGLPPQPGIDEVIRGLETGDPDVVPAAGPPSSLEEALRVGRIAEGVGAGSLEVATPVNETRPLLDGFTNGERNTSAAPVNTAPVAVFRPASGAEDSGSIPVNLSGTDVEDGRAPIVTVTRLPPAAQGQLFLADGVTPVVAGTPLTADQAASLVFVPARDFNGTVDLPFTVTDSGGATSAPATAPIVVTPVNDAPVAIVTPATGPEDSAIPVRLGGSDVDGSVVGVTITSVPAGAQLFLADGVTPVVAGQTLTPAQAASLLFLPPPGFNGPAAIGFTVTDNQGAVSGVATTPINVTAVNDLPVARPDTNATNEDTAVSANVITGAVGTGAGADSDPEGSALLVTGVGFGAAAGAVGTPLAGAYGSLLINADGSYTYTPGPAAQALPAGAQVTEVFSYTVSDGQGGSATTTLSIAVSGVNDAPNARDDLASTPINVPITVPVLANDSDPDNFPLQVTAATLADPTQGTLVVNPDGTLTFTPALNFSGPVLVNYTAQDASGVSDSATATIFVGPNTPPDSADRTVAGSEDVPVVLALTDFAFTDADAAQTLAGVRIDSLPAAGRLLLDGQPLVAGAVVNAADIAAGRLTFEPAPNANGTGYASFSFSVQDSGGAYDAAPNRITFDIAAVNDGPLAVNDTATTAEDTPLTLAPAVLLGNDTDTDGNPLSILSVQAAVNGTVALVGGNVVFTPAADYTGPASFTYTVSDGQGGTSTATVNVTVDGLNDPPVNTLPTGPLPVTEDTPLVFSTANGNAISVADPDGGSLTTTLSVDNGVLTLGSLAGVTVVGNGTGTVQITGTAAAINAALQGTAFSSTPDYNGPANLTVATTDGIATDVDTVALAIAAVADIAPDSVTTPEDTPITIAVLANDSFENPARTITAVDGNAIVAGGPAVAVANGSVVLDAAGQLVFTPAADFNGPASFTYSVTSGGVVETATVAVLVTPVNDAPVARPDVQVTAEDTPVSGNVLSNDTDVDGTALTPLALTQFVVGGVTYAAGSTATLAGVGTLLVAADGAYTFTPAPNFNGAVPQVGYTVTDGTATASSTLTLSVTPVNDAPVAAPDTGNASLGGVATGNVLANDSDPDGNTLSVTQFVVGGTTYAAGDTATLAGVGTLQIGPTGAYTFTPLAGYTGPVPQTTYTVSDGTGAANGTATSTLTLTISPFNDAPEPTLRVTPIGRWTFDETAGTVTTDAYNARSGTLTDLAPAGGAVAPVWVSGHVATSGSALNFDGAGSTVALTDAATQPLLGSSTLTFWIRTTQTGAGNAAGWDSPAVIASEERYGQNDIQWGAINAAGQIGFGIGDVAGVYSTTAINDGTWHQVAITRDVGTNAVSVYVDGQLEGTGAPFDGNYIGVPNRLAGFGQNNNFEQGPAGLDLPDNDFLRAQLDDLRIYDQVLTLDQVRAVRLVESGYHDTAIANDGEALRISLTATSFTTLTVEGLNAGMTISDGTNTATAAGPDSVIDLSTWSLADLSITGAGTGAATLAFNTSNTVAGETRSGSTQYLNIVNGTSLIDGTGGADNLVGTAQADLLSGRDGADTLLGNGGNDRLLGGAGADTLDGGAGRDVLIGGAGNDNLTGGAGADVFAWSLADRGAAAAPAIDTIADFDMAAVAAGGDKLDLRDLLQGSNYVGTDPGNLQNYLDFNVVGGNTEIRISTTGQFADGNYAAGQEDQRIVLSGIDIRASLGLGGAATDNQIIQELLTRGKLAGDGGP